MADELKYQDVLVLLVEPQAQLRGTIKTALNHAGLGHVDHTGSYERLADTIQRSTPLDVLICDMDLEDGKTCDLISRLRQNHLGFNPFLCVIGVTWRSEARNVMRMVNTGVDHLIMAPVAPDQIMKRIKSMVRNRLPFVVTCDYIGPDRRHNTRKSNDFPKMCAPNSLREKALDNWNPVEFGHQLDAAVGLIDSFRISREAENIANIADTIVAMSGKRKTALMIRPLVARLTMLVDDMDWRVAKGGFRHVTELCRACVGVVDEMKSLDILPTDQDVDLLKHLVMAIKAALEPIEETRSIAREISETVVAR